MVISPITRAMEMASGIRTWTTPQVPVELQGRRLGPGDRQDVPWRIRMYTADNTEKNDGVSRHTSEFVSVQPGAGWVRMVLHEPRDRSRIAQLPVSDPTAVGRWPLLAWRRPASRLGRSRASRRRLAPPGRDPEERRRRYASYVDGAPVGRFTRVRGAHPSWRNRRRGPSLGFGRRSLSPRRRQRRSGCDLGLERRRSRRNRPVGASDVAQHRGSRRSSSTRGGCRPPQGADSSRVVRFPPSCAQ